jgi:hypothetical protein
MRTVPKLGINTWYTAYNNELSKTRPLLRDAGIDTRNITLTEPSINKIQEYSDKKRYLDILQDHSIGQIQKVALAEMILDEYLYPGERTSKYTMSPMAGGLFRGWDDE